MMRFQATSRFAFAALLVLLAAPLHGAALPGAAHSTSRLHAPGLHAPGLQAQETGVVLGRVASGGQPVEGALVRAPAAGRDAVSDSTGAFRLAGLAPGRHTLEVTALGYARATQVVEVEAGAAVRVEVRLEVGAVSVDPLVITGTMRLSTVSESTVKVDVVPAAVLQRTASNNLMESISFVNGLYQQLDCGVCYTNNIRINGTEGPYTAVLIDGMPILSALASVYGLNGINPAVIERIEILKGPASTLYGTEAMGGVVNVITKDPRFAPRLAVEAYRGSLGESSVDFAVTPAAVTGRDAMRGFLSGSLSHQGNWRDANGDGFSDAPLGTRAALFGKADLRRDGRRVLGLSARAYYEQRLAGVADFGAGERGSGTVYGEYIDTRRGELIGSWLLPVAADALRTDFSLVWHDQDSYYGDSRYAARQGVAFANLLWQSAPSAAHDLLVGATARYQHYDDNTPATSTAERRFIPGFFVQDEWRPVEGLNLLGGVRLDHHAEHGLITAPRASLKWEPFEHTAVRLNGGTGFRVVNLFTEDHAALTGARDVVIAEELRPERSWSGALNVNQVIEMGPSPIMLDLDLFHTRFSNKIVADYDTNPDLILYENLRGHSVSRGVSLSLNQNVAFERLLYTLGATVQDVYAVEDGTRTRELFAPRFTGVAGLTYNHAGPDLSVDWSARLTGPMRLPEYPEPHARPAESRTYSVHDLKLTWRPAGEVQLYGALRNVFDFTQGTPLIDSGNPFGDAFDTAYVWGPIQGRELVVGGRWGVSR